MTDAQIQKINDIKAKIDAQVASGFLTKEQADKIKAHLDSKLDS